MSETDFDHEVMTDYFFQQHQIATELMLGLTDENYRKIASKWLHFLYDEDSMSENTSAKLLITQGLILMLNANVLVAPLNAPPTSDANLTKLSQLNFIHLVNHELNNIRPELPPKVVYEVSANGTEYVAYQKIPGYGAHFCYVHSGEPIVRTEPESGVIILDETFQLKRKIHPLIEKYRKEIEECLPEKRKNDYFQYKDLTNSFGGMKIPERDPDDDVVQECEFVNTDGDIARQVDSQILSDLDQSEAEEDGYAQFAADPVHHDKPRLSLKQTILDKEKEQRALLEERLKNRSIVQVQENLPKYKRTVNTRVKAVHLQPVSIGSNRVALVGRLPQTPTKTTNSAPRRDLIQAMHDLEHEIFADISNDSSISPNIRDKFDKVWNNPLMQDAHLSLPPPPKIDFDNILEDDQNQSI